MVRGWKSGLLLPFAVFLSRPSVTADVRTLKLNLLIGKPSHVPALWTGKNPGVLAVEYSATSVANLEDDATVSCWIRMTVLDEGAERQ